MELGGRLWLGQGTAGSPNGLVECLSSCIVVRFKVLGYSPAKRWPETARPSRDQVK